MRVLLLLLFSLPAHAAPHFQMKMLEGKRPQKEASQWNIADWLGQKSKTAFWDQWLAMNRQATTYESNFSAAHSRFDIQITDPAQVIIKDDGDGQVYGADFYITIFNIHGEYEKTSGNQEAYGGGIGLRIFGTSSQTTNIALKGGFRKLTDLSTSEAWNNTFGEAQIQLYLLKFMGLSGKYRFYSPATSKLENTLVGSRTTGGIFLEGMIFRLFADYYQEPMRLKDAAGAETKIDREGYEAGLKFYF